MRWRDFQGAAVQNRTFKAFVDCPRREVAVSLKKGGCSSYKTIEEDTEETFCSVFVCQVSAVIHRVSREEGDEREEEKEPFQVQLQVRFKEPGEFRIRLRDEQGNESKRILVVLPKGRSFHASIYVSLSVPSIIFVGDSSGSLLDKLTSKTTSSTSSSSSSSSSSSNGSGGNPHAENMLRGAVSVETGKTPLLFGNAVKSNKDQRLLFWMTVFGMVSFRMSLFRLYHKNNFRVRLEDRVLIPKTLPDFSLTILGLSLDSFDFPSVYELELSLLPDQRIMRSSIFHTLHHSMVDVIRRTKEFSVAGNLQERSKKKLEPVVEKETNVVVEFQLDKLGFEVNRQRLLFKNIISEPNSVMSSSLSFSFSSSTSSLILSRISTTLPPRDPFLRESSSSLSIESRFTPPIQRQINVEPLFTEENSPPDHLLNISSTSSSSSSSLTSSSSSIFASSSSNYDSYASYLSSSAATASAAPSSSYATSESFAKSQSTTTLLLQRNKKKTKKDPKSSAWITSYLQSQTVSLTRWETNASQPPQRFFFTNPLLHYISFVQNNTFLIQSHAKSITLTFSPSNFVFLDLLFRTLGKEIASVEDNIDRRIMILRSDFSIRLPMLDTKSLQVVRTDLINSICVAMRNLTDETIQQNFFKIRLVDEKAIDLKGVLRGICDDMGTSLLQPFSEYGPLFKMTDSGYAIVNRSVCELASCVSARQKLRWYWVEIGRWFGKLVADNLYSETYERHIPLLLPSAFWKIILGYQLSLIDFEKIFPDNELSFLASHSLSDFVDQIGYTPSYDQYVYDCGHRQTIQPRTTLTEATKHEFILSKVYCNLYWSVRWQIDAFKEGFFRAVPSFLMETVLGLNWEELALIVQGGMTFSPSFILDKASYSGFSTSEKKRLVQLISEMSPDQIKKLMRFAQGSSSRLFNPEVRVSFMADRAITFPLSATCSMKISLNPQNMIETLPIAIEFADDFGLA